MKTAARTQATPIEQRREARPENLSKAGKWAMENPNGIATIVNRRAVNR